MKRQFPWPLVFLAALTLLGDAWGQTNTMAGDEIAESLQFDDLPLPDAIRHLATLAKINVQFDPKLESQVDPATQQPIPYPTVKEAWRNLTPRQALEAILSNYGWQMTQVSNNPVFRISAMAPDRTDPRLVKVDLAAKRPMTEAEDEIARPMQFDDTPLPDAIRQLATIEHINIQFDRKLVNCLDPATHQPIPDPEIKVRWRYATPRQALEALLSNYGWQLMQISNNPVCRIVAMAPGMTDPRVTKVDLLAKKAMPGPGDEVAESLQFDGLPAPDAVHQLANLAGIDLQFDPKLENQIDPATQQPIPFPTVNEKWIKLTPSQALDSLLTTYGWQLTQISNNPICRVTPMPPWMSDPRTMKVTSIPEDKATGDFAFDAVALPDVIHTLATQARINVQFDRALIALLASAPAPLKVTKKWKGVSPSQVLFELLEEHGWQLYRSVNGPVFRIGVKSRDAF